MQFIQHKVQRAIMIYRPCSPQFLDSLWKHVGHNHAIIRSSHGNQESPKHHFLFICSLLFPSIIQTSLSWYLPSKTIILYNTRIKLRKNAINFIRALENTWKYWKITRNWGCINSNFNNFCVSQVFHSNTMHYRRSTVQ